MSTSEEVAAELLVVACPTCLGSAAASLALVGRPVRCPLCAAGYLVPAPPSEPSATAAAPAAALGMVIPDPDAVMEGPAPGDPAIPLVVGEREGITQRAKLAARDRRRSRRNIMLAVVGSLILAVLVYLLGGR